MMQTAAAVWVITASVSSEKASLSDLCSIVSPLKLFSEDLGMAHGIYIGVPLATHRWWHIIKLHVSPPEELRNFDFGTQEGSVQLVTT